ncbi:MAG: acriflavin resistance protein [Alteromonadaceae bacterium]|nr:acriflavin resistance protein [Alteromonadaceae bacterium]
MIDRLLANQRLLGMVVAMLCLLGLASYLTMARQEDPNFPHRAGIVTVVYPGATAESVERLVLDPLSDELLQVEEVDIVEATARAGVAMIRVRLWDTIYDTDSAWERVRQAMDRAERDFPGGIDRMELDDRIIDNPTVTLAITGSPSVIEMSAAADRLKQALSDLPGLARVEVAGDVDEQITLGLDDSAMRRLGLTPDNLLNSLAVRNRVIPGGHVTADGKRIGVLPNSEFSSLEDLAATAVELPDGGLVPLAAVAEVWRGPVEPRQAESWYDGERAVTVSLFVRAGQTDAIAFGEAVRERLTQLRPLFEPLQINEMFFQPDQVQERLSDLEVSLIFSVLIVIAVVFFGMGLRMGVLVATTLPLVALISLGLYDLGGGILHQVAVVGMVISLGILIDNAIVIVENIQTRLNAGAGRKEAMSRAISELAGPLGASTGTTLAAFMPLLLSKGGTGDFTRGIPVMIMLTLSISYLLAISVIPLLAGRFLKPSPDRDDPIGGMALRLGQFSAEAPRTVLAIGGGMMVLSLLMVPFMKLQFFPNADRPQVVVEMRMPAGTDLAETGAVASSLEKIIRQRPETESVHRFVGYAGPAFYYNLIPYPESPNRARLVVNTPSLEDTRALMLWLREEGAQHVPQAELVASILGQGPPRAAPVEVRLFNPDQRSLGAAAEQVFRLLRSHPGTVDVRHDLDFGAPTLLIEVDDAIAARHGVTRADVARSLYGQSFGLQIEQYRREDDPIALVLRSLEGADLPVERLLSVNIYNDRGEGVPLSQVARVDSSWQPAAIYQRNGARVTSVFANLRPGYSYSQVLAELERGLDETPLPLGTRMEYGGDSEGSTDANSALLKSAPVGVLLLLFFLLLQFNSFRRVAIVLTTVPLAAVGVIPGLVLSGSAFGFQSVLGVIALVGIVVNNAIVLIDVLDRQLARGETIADAVQEAVIQRARPILLTTATTVAGLLPLVFSSSTLWPPMAWAIISGLLASTVLTLLVVPAICRLSLARDVVPQAPLKEA